MTETKTRHREGTKNKSKYGFSQLEEGNQKEVTGCYDIIQMCAKSYSRRHNVKIIALRGKGNLVTIIRLKL